MLLFNLCNGEKSACKASKEKKNHISICTETLKRLNTIDSVCIRATYVPNNDEFPRLNPAASLIQQRIAACPWNVLHITVIKPPDALLKSQASTVAEW